MYTRKRNSGLRRQRKAEGGRGYQLFPHPRHIPPGLAKNSDCGRAGRAGGHNPPPFGLGAEPANTGTSLLPVGCSHIHPKTACREVRERQWRSAAPVSAPASASAGRFPLGSGTRGSRRDQVLLSLPQNRRKHWVFAGFLFACVARLCGSRWFKVRLFAPGFIRSQPFPSPPPPKTHPASPFRALPGALRSFYPLLIREIPRIFALSLALEMIQDSVEHPEPVLRRFHTTGPEPIHVPGGHTTLPGCGRWSRPPTECVSTPSPREPSATLHNGRKMPMEGFGVFQVRDMEECKRSVLEAIKAG